MVAFRSASFCLIVCFLICSSEAQKIITAELGKNVILPCEVLNNNINIAVVEWSRPDQDPEYVLLYRHERLDPHYQHPSYQNRVDLQDKKMKDGDVSLILKNVKMEDTGTYKCYVAQGGTNRKKRSDPEPISIVNLEVHPSGEKFAGDKDGIIAGSVVSGILLPAVVSVGLLIYRRRVKTYLHVTPVEATV